MTGISVPCGEFTQIGFLFENRLAELFDFEDQQIQLDWTDKSSNEFTVGKWKFAISRTTEKFTEKMSLCNFVNGEFMYTEPLGRDDKMKICRYLEKSDSTRKLFGGIGKLSECVPKCSSGGIFSGKQENTFVLIKITCQL